MKYFRGKAFYSSAVVAAGLIAATPGMAAQRGINIPPAAITVQGTATSGSTVGLPNTATPAMFITFVLPPDYAADTTVKLQVYMQQASGACSAVVSVGSSTRRRNGLASTNTAGGVQPGGNSPVVSFAGVGIVKVKTYNVKAPVSGLTGVLPGDAISIRLDRLVDDVSDNCGSTVFVGAAQVIYEAAP